jgi:ABC-type transporter Mla subunit MlaD
LAKANVSSAETVQIAAKSKELNEEIRTTRDQLVRLATKAQSLLNNADARIDEQIKKFDKAYETLATEKRSDLESLAKKVESNFSEASLSLR